MDTISNALEIQQYNNFIDNADTSTVHVYVPKFKIEYKLLLNTVLTAMWMEQSYGGKDDFFNLFVEESDLSICSVIHQTFLEVDEAGTEAAAAPVLEIRETSAGADEKTSVIHIDRPFAFYIRERHAKTILFSGKLIDPSR